MENIEYYHKLDALISRFENGKERYQKDPMMRASVLSILNGSDPITVLDQVLTAHAEQGERFLKYVEMAPLPIMITKGQEIQPPFL